MLPPALTIRLIISDVDGVWTDGRIIYAGEHREIKEFHVRDGLGVKLAQKVGVTVALLTSRRSHALERRARELGITEIHQGAANKLEACERLGRQLGLRLDEGRYAGDEPPRLGPRQPARHSPPPRARRPEGVAAAPADRDSP